MTYIVTFESVVVEADNEQDAIELAKDQKLDVILVEGKEEYI